MEPEARKMGGSRNLGILGESWLPAQSLQRGGLWQRFKVHEDLTQKIVGRRHGWRDIDLRRPGPDLPPRPAGRRGRQKQQENHKGAARGC